MSFVGKFITFNRDCGWVPDLQGNTFIVLAETPLTVLVACVAMTGEVYQPFKHNLKDVKVSDEAT